jgi:UDP-glucose 6-dehydrogenase
MFDICTSVGADWDKIREVVQMHPFVGYNHFDVHHGGFRGYSGKCLPKDTKAIAYGFNCALLKAVDKLNAYYLSMTEQPSEEHVDK